MRTSAFWLKIKIMLIFIICFIAFCKTSYAKEEIHNKRILFISSYHYSFSGVPEQIKGIKSVLVPSAIELDVEFMDTRRFPTEDYLNQFYNIIHYKLNVDNTYDGIIVADDYALQFVLDYYDELFYQFPISFMGVNEMERVKEASTHSNITGVATKLSIKENIALVSKMFPNTKNIVAIVDNSYTGKGDLEQYLAYTNEDSNLLLTYLNVSEYRFDEIKLILSQYDEDTVFFYFSMYQDKEKAILKIPESIQLISNSTESPIFLIGVGEVGNGLIGGQVVSQYESGRIAAGMMLDILSGKKIVDIPIVTDVPYDTIFDYELLQKYKISDNVVPSDTMFKNRKLSYYDKNENLINLLLAVFSLLFFVFCFLFLDNVKRKRLQKDLTESHDELVLTYEELTASEEELKAQYETISEHSERIDILNQKYAIAIESTESAVWEFDINTKLMRLSKNFINDINRNIKQEDNIYDIFKELFTEDSKQSLIKEFYSYINGRTEEINITLPIYDIRKNKRWIIIRGKGVRDNSDHFNTIHGIVLEVTKMRKQEEHIEYLAQHDYITGLPNRYSFIQSLIREIKRESTGAVILLDIDNFKAVNDTLGHVCGDKMLYEISERFRNIPIKDYEVSRFGGDEFLMVLKNYEDIKEIEEAITSIQRLFEEPILIDNSEYYVKFSIGISRYPFDDKSVEQLLMNIDTAMYHVKKNGRNNYMFYEESMNDELVRRTKIEALLIEAEKEDGFKLVYQPQVDVKSGEIIGFEGLIRLKNHTTSPAEFIAIAEENGMILKIGRWVIEQAVKQLSIWKEEGKELKPIAINFSSKQMNDKGFLKYLSECIKKYDVSAQYLEIEITESVLLEKSENTLVFLHELRDLGVKLALDDFGTGFSSLNYITYIPVHKIKLDKSLCERFLRLKDNTVMLRLIDLIHSLGLVITAEGIETLEQFNILKESGCNYIQGYLFSKPLNEDEISNIYNKNMFYRLQETKNTD